MTRLFDVARKSDNAGMFIFADSEDEARQIAFDAKHVKKMENIRTVEDITDSNLKHDAMFEYDTLSRAIASGHKGVAVMLIPSLDGHALFSALFSGSEPPKETGKRAWVIGGQET